MSRNYLNSEAFRDQVSRDLRSDAEFERRQRETRLTAAAPDLLNALKRWQTFARDNGWTDDDYHTGGVGWITEMDAAITSAEG